MAKKSSSKTIEKIAPGDVITGNAGETIHFPRDLFAAPADADLGYISADLRVLAVRVDSLVLDDLNVKDHGETDLPTHQASLREFGIRRAIVVQRSTRKIEAGNGTALAAMRNGWDFVPVIFEDDDGRKARAFALADNAVGTLAGWNEANLAAIAAESESLFSDLNLQEMTSNLLAEIQQSAEQDAENAEEVEQKETKVTKEIQADEIELCYRVIATCSDQKAQIELLAELMNRGLECRLSTLQVR